jgi:HPt (histidine-containing phosphotransfer) domain-containing protein
MIAQKAPALILLRAHRNMSCAISKGPLDESELQSRFAGKLPLLRRLTKIFDEQTPRLLAEMRTAIEEGNATGLAHTAHTLKGSLAQMGAPSASELAHELEKAAGNNILSPAGVLLEQLEQQIADLQRTLDRLTE